MTEPVTDWTEIFYTLPASDTEEGMSTADGQDILNVSTDPDGDVYLTVYTPRTDDPELDEQNRAATETRGPYPAATRITLAVFSDTEIDGSERPNAITE